MKTAMTLPNTLKNLSIPFGLLALVIGLTQTSFFSQYPSQLALGISVDLLLLIPILYFFAIRKTEIPNITVIPFTVASLLLGSYALPEQHQSYLELFKSWGLPVIELIVVVVILGKVRQTLRSFKQHQGTSIDFYETLQKSCQEVLPKPVANVFAMEIGTLYYAFATGFTKKLNDNEFSSYKETGSIALYLAVLLIIGIETFVLHVYMIEWNSTIAWIITIASCYTGIQFLGYLKSLVFSPTTLSDTGLHLKYGMMRATFIPYDAIENITLFSKDLEEDSPVKKLSILGSLESHTLRISLRTATSLTSLYGMHSEYKELVFHIDKPGDFIEALQKKIHQFSIEK